MIPTGRRARVLHVITWMDLGGAQDHLLSLVAGLDPERFEIMVAVGSAGGERGVLVDELVGLTEVVPLKHLQQEVAPLSDLSAVAEIRRLVDRARVDIVHTHSSKAGVVGRLGAGRAHVVHNVHGWSFSPWQAGMRRRAVISLERWLARRTDVLVFVSNSDLREAESLGVRPRQRAELIRSGISLDRFRRDAARRCSPSAELKAGHPVIGTVGRLAPQKGPFTAVEVLAQVLQSEPSARLRWVGDGPLHDEVIAYAQRAGVLDRLDLVGSSDDVPGELECMDVFLLTSRWEGLPRSLVEAVAAGVPVVATDVGGVSELIVDGDTGGLASPDDVAALAGRVVSCLESPSRAMAMAARASERIDSYSAEEMCRKTAAVYESLL